MKRFLQLFKIKRIVSVLLLISMLSSYFLVEQRDLNYTYDPSALQTNYINLMKGGKAGVTGNTDAIMTMDDLRNIAMFLSCSYVPFYTSLDGDSKDKWIDKGVSMLTQIGFDKQVATTLVNATYEASLNSASKIYVSTSSLGKVNTGTTGVVVDGFGRNQVSGVTSSGWFMTIDGSGASDIFNGDFDIKNDYGVSFPAVFVDEISYTNGTFKDARIVSNDLGEILDEKSRIITSVKADNVKYINAGGNYHFYPYDEDIHAGKPVYQLYFAYDTHMEEDPTNGEHEVTNYYLVMCKGSIVESELDNRFVLLEENQYETKKGIMNGGYRRAVGDGGYAGYTPLTLEMFWSLIDNYYYDSDITNNSDIVTMKTGHVTEYNNMDDISLYTPVSNTEIKDVNSDNGNTDDTSSEDGNIDDGTSDENTNDNASDDTNDVLSTVDTEAALSSNTLKKIGAIDDNLISYLAYVVSYSDDSNIGCTLNAFINGDIGGMFNGKSLAVSNGEFESLIALFQCMYVDWVGNILVDVGTERVIVVPACANKYAFTDIENHDVKQNILSPLYMQLLRSDGGNGNNVVLTNTDLYYSGTPVELEEILSKGSADLVTWDNKNSLWINLGEAGVLKDYLESNYGLSVTGTGANNWTSFGYFHLKRELALNKSSMRDEFLVYESIKQSGIGNVTDLSTSLVSASLLGGFSNYMSYFSAEGTSKFKGNGNYDKFFSFSNNDTAMLQNLFLTYTFAYTNHTYHETFDKSKHHIDMRFNYDVFPSVTGSIQWESVDSTDAEIASFVYYFLHPTKGIKYVATWFKNKVSGIFINWHEDVVGSSDSNSVTGMTQYLGFSGYVTTPNLEDISWVSGLVSGYDSIIIYLIIIMMVIMICYILVGAITLQRGIIGILMFSFLAFLPPIGINMTVNIINKICESMYSTKFDYWAAVQTEEYLGLLTNVENAVTVTDYVTALMKVNAEASASTSIGGASATGYSGVKVKWLSPKKFNEMAAFSSEVQDKIDKSKSGISGWTLNALVSTQEFSTGMEFYLNSDSVSYLYRDLLDIYRYGSCSYYMYTGDFVNFDDEDEHSEYKRMSIFVENYAESTCLGSKIYTSNPNYSLQPFIMANMENSNALGHGYDVPNAIQLTSSLEAIRKGYLYPTVYTSVGVKSNYFGGNNNTNAASLLLMNSRCVGESIDRYNDLKGYVESGTLDINVDDIIYSKYNNIMFGLGQWEFKNGINEFISGSVGSYSEDNNGSYDGYYYSLYSESPYYFFSFNIRDQVHSSMNYNYDYQSLKNSASEDDFYKLLIRDNQSYFYNLSENAGDGYGELRDFMNMHDFFYYIMPVLKPGNDLTNLFADVFGMDISDHSTLHLSADGQIHYSGLTYGSLSAMENVLRSMTKEELYEFWHDYNVRTVYNAYTPWLNLMYACDYARPEKIQIMGETFVVSNPLDPTSYFTLDDNGNMIDGRYMVFSRSEQKANGIQWSDLTSVEQKIITLQENVYNQSIRIMDYYSLSNETLISYMAMLELFEFNKVFSQESMLNGSYILYPQSYELKAFTYDAYLRLILNGATEGSNYQDELQVTGGQSIYERILEKTSIFFGIVLLANDFVAVYLIPMLKLFFLVTIFLVSVLIIIAATTKLETPGGGILQVVWKSLVAPLGMFALISIGMAGAVVLFMSSGGGSVTKKFVHISLGDPTMTCIAMLIINIVALILYYKLCAKVFKDFKKYVTSVFDTIGSNVVGAVGRVAGVVAPGNAMKSLKNIDKGINGGNARTASQRGRDNVPNIESARTSESMLAKSGGGMSDAGGIGGTGGAGGVDNASVPKLGSKYDAKLSKLDKKDNVARDKLEKSAKKRAEYEEKADGDPSKLSGLKRKEGKYGAKEERLATKRNNIINAANKKQEFSKQKAENVRKYGRIYGTAKNVGATLSYTKDKAGRARDTFSYGVGSIVSRVENFGGDIKQFGSDAIRTGRQAVNTVKRMPATAKGAKDYVSDTVANGANRMYKVMTDPYAGQEICNSISRRASSARKTVASASRSVWSQSSYKQGRSNTSYKGGRTIRL